LHALDESPADEVADGVEIVRRTREDLPGCVPVVEGTRIPQIRGVEELAHASFDPDAEARGRVAAREVDEEAQSGETDDGEDVRPEGLCVLDDRVVDRLLHEQWNGDRDERVGEGEREADPA